MALPSSPSHGDIGVWNGNNFVFDSDESRWTITRTDRELAIEQDLDSDVLYLRGLINGSSPSSGFPVGSVLQFSKSNLPNGFLLADGSVFNTSLYPELFEFLGSDVLPDYSNRTLSFKVYDLNDSENYDEVVFGIAGFSGAGLTSDSEIIATLVAQRTTDLDSDIAVLQARVTELEGDLAQAVADRVFTDNQLSARLDGHDSDIALRGRFYVQSTAPSGGPNSGWVNTTNMKLNVWDETSDAWVEVVTT